MQHRAVELAPKDHPIMPALLHNLGIFLNDRFERLGELDDIENAILAQRRAVELAPEGHPDKPAHLDNMGFYLNIRFERLGELNDLESAISMRRRAVELTPKGHSKLSSRLSNLGNMLGELFNRVGKLSDLESAISLQRRAIELSSEGHPDTPRPLGSLGSLLRSRFERLGDLNDLQSAVSTLCRAVELTPENHFDMPLRLNSLGICLSDRFDRLGDLSDLENAILTQRRAVKLTPKGHPSMPSRLSNLASYLNNRFNHLGALDDLESAISTQCRAIELMPEGHPDMPSLLNLLGACLDNRFNRLGELDDLESAISMQRRAVELTPEGHAEIPGRLGNLGSSLRSRFERLREFDDLERAILTQRRAVELTSEEHQDFAGRLKSLGNCLSSRFEHLGEVDDLENAISTLRRAVEFTPVGHPDLPSSLNSLGSSLLRRFKRLGEPNDLESALSTQRRAIELTPEGHPDMPIRHTNLAICLSRRFDHLGELYDLKSAILMHRRATELTPADHPNMLWWHGNLGIASDAHFRLQKEQHNFDAVVQSYQTVSLRDAGIPFRRLECATLWAQLEHEFPEFGSVASRLHAHSSIIDVLPEVVWLGHSISRRYQESSQVARYVGDAVSAAINSGDLQLAVEWLDAGRGLIWAQVLSLRTPVDGLARDHPVLADRLKNLSAQLQHAHMVQLPKTASPVNSFFGDETNQHRSTVAKYEKLIKEIRAQPGFEHFLRPQKHASLSSVAEHFDGHVVFFNISSSRSDALALSRGGAVKLVPLPELKQSRADTLSVFCTNFLFASKVRQRAVPSRNAAKGKGFFRLLDRIWKWIVRPVLEGLELMNTNQVPLPHITWCPTGPLTQLPLHAAGLHPESGQAGPHTYDFVVSSYTPSLSALARVQSSAAQPNTSPSVLIVTQSNTPNMPSLPGTDEEGAQLQNILSESQISSEALSNAQATVQSVEAVVQKFPWVHFACHGVQDPADPTQSAFTLHDGGLTLSTLMKTVSENAELAFLSACQTATGDDKAPEESAHLTAGMLAVGFKGVVGTMWSIGDADAPVVVEAYYKKLLELRRMGAVAEGSTGAAYALHEAVRVLRERVGETSFLRWVPFVHYGV